MSSSSDLTILQTVTIVFTFFMPIHSFSLGLSHSDEGRSFRAPDKLENSLFMPFGGMYVLFVAFVLNCIEVYANRLFSINLGLCCTINEVFQSALRLFSKEELVLDKFLSFLPNSTIANCSQNQIIPIFIFYVFFIFLFPFFAGKFANDVSFDRDYIRKSWETVSGIFRGLSELKTFEKHRKIKIFLQLSWKNIIYLILTALFFPFTWTLFVFIGLDKAKLLKPLLKLFSSESIPEDLTPVYNPNKTVIVDLTLSEKKMITGILSNVQINNKDESIQAFILEYPLKRERIEKFKLVNPKLDKSFSDILTSQDFRIQKDIRIRGDAVKIPCKSFLIPYSIVQEMNIYVVPHDIYFFIYGTCNKNNVTNVYSQIIDHLKGEHTTNYIFSDVVIFYEGNIESLLRPMFDQNKIQFKRIEYESHDVEILKFFNKAILNKSNNVIAINL